MKTKWSIQKLIYTGMLAAVAGALMSLEFSVPMMPPFYKIDFSDVPSIIALFLMGPASAAWVEIIKIIIKLITEGGKTRRAAIASLAVSVPIRTLFACFCNAFITLPLYAAAMGLPLNQVITMVAAVNPAISDLTTFIFLATIPFNLIKLGLNCFVGYLLYTRLLAVYPAVRTA